MARTESGTLMQKGASAEIFALESVEGRTYTLDDFRGREGLFVLFMCNHCPYVKARMGEVVALHKQFGNLIAFVGINSSDPEYPGEGMANMKIFAQQYGIEFPYLMDEHGTVAKAYGATCTPDPFLFSSSKRGTTLSEPGESKGEFALVYHGRIVDALEPNEPVKERTLHDAMQKFLNGAPIEPWFNPSVGCSIKFKN